MQIERKKKSKCKLSKSEITQLYTEGKSTSEIATLMCLRGIFGWFYQIATYQGAL